MIVSLGLGDFNLLDFLEQICLHLLDLIFKEHFEVVTDTFNLIDIFLPIFFALAEDCKNIICRRFPTE